MSQNAPDSTSAHIHFQKIPWSIPSDPKSPTPVRGTPILHALLTVVVPCCREALGMRTRAEWRSHDGGLRRICDIFLLFYEEKCKNVIFFRCCLRNTYSLLILCFSLRADFVAEVVGRYCWIVPKGPLKYSPRLSAVLKRWSLKLELHDAVHR